MSMHDRDLHPFRITRVFLPLACLASALQGLAGCSAPGSNPSRSDAAAWADPEPRPVEAPPPSEAALPAPADHDSGGAGGKWELTVSGTGVSDKHLETGTASATAGLSYYLSDVLQLGVRQSVFYIDGVPDDGDSSTNASTRGALDFNFGEGSVRPVIGATVGRVYGDTVNDTWIAGPEAGIKFFFHDNAFLQLLAEYQFFFDDEEGADDAFEDGSFLYTLGFGVIL